MSDSLLRDKESLRLFTSLVDEASPPDWLEAMKLNLRRTGQTDALRLRGVLGDPAKGVELGTSAQLLATMLNGLGR